MTPLPKYPAGQEPHTNDCPFDEIEQLAVGPPFGAAKHGLGTHGFVHVSPSPEEPEGHVQLTFVADTPVHTAVPSAPR